MILMVANYSEESLLLLASCAGKEPLLFSATMIFVHHFIAVLLRSLKNFYSIFAGQGILRDRQTKL